MTIYHLRLKAVDSRKATPDELGAAEITPDQIPDNYALMAHQVETIRALRSGSAPIVINQAMTGDGKTLAGQMQLFSQKVRTLAMYPTNELIKDQKRGLDALRERWTPPLWQSPRLDVHELNEATLDDAQLESMGMSRPEVLQGLTRTDLLLTNPDVFHLMMQFVYQQHGAAHDMILGAVISRYRLFVFDEFHPVWRTAGGFGHDCDPAGDEFGIHEQAAFPVSICDAAKSIAAPDRQSRGRSCGYRGAISARIFRSAIRLPPHPARN